MRFGGLTAAIGAIKSTLRLITPRIVVDHGDGIDVPTHGRFDFSDVIPESGIAGECHDGPLRCGTFGAEAGRECPAEMAGATHITLGRRQQSKHPAHTHAGMSSI